MSLSILWKGKIGYGDIVSPICYSHNLSHKLQIPVKLTFRWDFDPTHKIHKSDPETLWERACFIEKQCHKGSTQVQILHKFNDPLGISHTNYDWKIVGSDSFHNYWFPKHPNQQSSNTIVVNSTEDNIVSLKDYGKSWKDPAASYWPTIIKKIKSKGYDVQIVNYRTPIHELIDVMKTARGFVGYHGTAAWPAKFMHVPSILFSNGGTLTSSSFRYAVVERDGEQWEKVIDNLEMYLDESNNKIQHTRDKYKTYMPRKEFLRHLHHD